jgi:hypothetical protein
LRAFVALSAQRVLPFVPEAREIRHLRILSMVFGIVLANIACPLSGSVFPGRHSGTPGQSGKGVENSKRAQFCLARCGRFAK